MSSGIFIVSELTGEPLEQVRAIQRRFDPKLSRMSPPHITLAGSSGVGPIPLGEPVETLREALQPVADETAPFTVPFGRPHRFMQTHIVVLPLDPNGPLRALHERIARSGLPFGRSKFTFAPHCTLSFYRELTPENEKALLRVRVDAPARLDRIQLYRTSPPQTSACILELWLRGE